MNKHGDSGLVLYTHEVSPWGDRAVAMLREANLKFDYVVLNPFEPPEYFKEVSPLGKIPALSVDGKSVLESWVILEYINDRFLESK
ncbi:thioredoxin-like protein [Blakeslea trispora]|nr:thioredoxin-like protein [Blakeslea trispora]